MKKIISFLFIAATFATANAQTATPRTGTGPNNDNTYRAMTITYRAVTDTAGNDTVLLNFNGFKNMVKMASVTDSVCINMTPITRCYYGDMAEFTFTNSSGSGHNVKFVGPNVESADGSSATLALTSAKRATISFVFDGVKWVETRRVVQ